MILTENYNCFFPRIRRADIAAPAAGFALVIHGSNVDHLHIVKALYSVLDLYLISLFVNLKSVGITRIGKMHTLFGYYRPYYYIAVIHFSTFLSCLP
jgi:hypothetical protein